MPIEVVTTGRMESMSYICLSFVTYIIYPKDTEKYAELKQFFSLAMDQIGIQELGRPSDGRVSPTCL